MESSSLSRWVIASTFPLSLSSIQPATHETRGTVCISKQPDSVKIGITSKTGEQCSFSPSRTLSLFHSPSLSLSRCDLGCLCFLCYFFVLSERHEMLWYRSVTGSSYVFCHIPMRGLCSLCEKGIALYSLQSACENVFLAPGEGMSRHLIFWAILSWTSSDKAFLTELSFYITISISKFITFC